MQSANGRTYNRCDGIVVLGVVDRGQDGCLGLAGMARKNVERRRDRLEQECPGVPAVACIKNGQLLFEGSPNLGVDQSPNRAAESQARTPGR